MEEVGKWVKEMKLEEEEDEFIDDNAPRVVKTDNYTGTILTVT